MGIETAHSVPTPADQSERWPPWRVWTIRIWYGLLALWALSMSRGVVSLILGEADTGERFVYAVVTAWKLLALGGVLGVCWTGGRSVLAFHSVVTGWLGWMGSELLYAERPADDTPVMSAVTTVVLWILPLVLLRPDRRELLRLQLAPSAILLPLALAAAVPLSMYAVRHGALANGLSRRVELEYVACGLGAVIAVQAVFAALRPRGSRWFPRFVALVGVYVGLAAVIWPHDVASLGRGWGTALVCWALLFAMGSWLEERRDPARAAAASTVAAQRRRISRG